MPSFHVVRVEGRTTQVCGVGGQPFVFETAEQAQWYANQMATESGVKHQLRPIKEIIDWRKREMERFTSGHYTKVPWANEPWVAKCKDAVDHFVHVSRNDPTRVAYTADKDRGERDLKTPMRPSRYLSNWYKHYITEAVIREWVAKYKKLYDKDNVLNIAYDADEIERVYRRGPQSCMSAPTDAYNTNKIHPVRAYAGPDLAVAYVEKGSRIIARSVVWPKKHIYTRIYGDDYLLSQLLEEEGYQEGSLEGARLSKIVTRGNVRPICPYIDYSRTVVIGKKYLRVDSKKGVHPCSNTDGRCGHSFRCAMCRLERLAKNPHGSVDNSWVSVDSVIYCRTCLETALARQSIFRCGRSGNYYSMSRGQRMWDGSIWHESYAHSYNCAFRCTKCSEFFPLDMRHSGDPGLGRGVCKPCMLGGIQQELSLAVEITNEC